MEEKMRRMDESLEAARGRLGEAAELQAKLEGEINVRREQIHAARQNEEHFKARQEELLEERGARLAQKAEFEKEKAACDEEIRSIEEQKSQVMGRYQEIQEEIAKCGRKIEDGKNEIISLLNGKASIKARQQRYDTMAEQIRIRKSQLSSRMLSQKDDEEEIRKRILSCREAYEKAKKACEEISKEQGRIERKRREWQQKETETSRLLEKETTDFHRERSRLETLVNIAERYDGYGNAIRRVMERREDEPGVLGVVADLIQVEKRYEVAIETALGGSIQNIVTSDEETAKRMISYLKENRYGRATFLPLPSVGKSPAQPNRAALEEPGVIGMGSSLAQAEERFAGLKSYLLGRTYVVDTISHALALARKYRYGLRIVTLEGELLNPGGSITGGAFKESGNLLGRKREIEELQARVADLAESLKARRARLEEIRTARELLKDDIRQAQEEMGQAMLEQNTAKMSLERAEEQKEENDGRLESLLAEGKELEAQLSEIAGSHERIREEIREADLRQRELEEENEKLQEALKEQNELARESQDKVSGVQLEEASLAQKSEFAGENAARVGREIEKLDEDIKAAAKERDSSKEDADRKSLEIEELCRAIEESKEERAQLEGKIAAGQQEREEISARYKGFFQKQEELSGKIHDLDKELYRLNGQREKLDESASAQADYMWREYELTPHHAEELRSGDCGSLPQMKERIGELRDEIRKLGDVNVNAIEDYKELSERYGFLKAQHDDLVGAEKTLLGLIDDLDKGMRTQFLEKFAQIQQEFDKVFRELFGGGQGTLELVEDEDILECGIRVIAQPPGKKLQNMMQLSGGEKSLTAIALLFAIQNLKPSPFCLLDEIEAALDDPNVLRFAEYLHKLTENTQFIVITHRRGTMAAADRLYGITMQEKGVSTLVSVNLIEEDLT